MKTKDLIKYFFSLGAVIFTAGATLILIISMAASNASSSFIIAPKPFFFYLGFSYALALGSTLYRIEAMSRTARRLLHVLCYVVGFFVFILLCGIEFAFTAIFTAIFGVIYALSVVCSALIKKKTAKARVAASESPTNTKNKTKRTAKNKKPEPEQYQSRFS